MQQQQVVVIHGGNAFETYDEYLSFLKSKEVTLERLTFKDWKKNLPEVLGDGYQVLAPQMPNAWNARYAEWKIYFERLVPILNDTVIFVGHSLGGIFLAKYLSENDFPKNVKATFLVAAPYNTNDEHPFVDFNIMTDLSGLQKQGGKVFLYHSKDDEVVPFSAFMQYQKALPEATVRVFEDRQHFKTQEFPELVADIKSLM